MLHPGRGGGAENLMALWVFLEPQQQKYYREGTNEWGWQLNAQNGCKNVYSRERVESHNR